MIRWVWSTVMIASAAMPRMPANFISDARSASSTLLRALNRDSTSNCRASTNASAVLTTRSEIDRSGLHEKSELQRELNVLRSMRQTQLLLNSLLVGVDRFRTDEQALTNLRRRIPLCNEAQHVTLALRQLV